MSGKVEEVARAIREASPSAGRRDSHLRSQMLSEAACLDLARAAIEAMREPTLEMMEDGDRSYRAIATSGVSGMTIEAQIRSKCVRFVEGWRAAIDAALREEGR